MTSYAVPDMLKVVRMLRTERDYTFHEAVVKAVQMFDVRGWPVADAWRNIQRTKREEGQ